MPEQTLWEYAMKSNGIKILLMVLSIISIITVAVSAFVRDIVGAFTLYGTLVILMWFFYYLRAANSYVNLYETKRRKERVEKLKKLARDLFGEKGEELIEVSGEVLR